MFEEWRDIPGYEGIYQASSLGRIRSLDTVRETKRGPRRYKGKLLSQVGHSGGYLKVGLCVAQKTEYPFVHRLVAAAFFGPSDLTVNHINENKHDNRVTNLEYLTLRENVHYGTGQSRSKAAQHRTPVESYDLVTGETIKKYASQKEAGRDGFDQKTIWLCCHGKCDHHKGVGWRFIERGAA